MMPLINLPEQFALKLLLIPSLTDSSMIPPKVSLFVMPIAKPAKELPPPTANLAQQLLSPDLPNPLKMPLIITPP